MKKWLVYLLGIITGVILTFAFAFYVNLSNNSGIVGLEMFEEPGDYMEYSQFEVFQVVESGCALAHADDSFGAIVFIIPNKFVFNCFFRFCWNNLILNIDYS